jgi:hypothetical protein
MKPDTILESLIRGRLLAAVAGSGIAAGSLLELTANATDELTAVINSVLGLVAALAAVYSKLREMQRGEAGHDE